MGLDTVGWCTSVLVSWWDSETYPLSAYRYMLPADRHLPANESLSAGTKILRFHSE